MTSEDFSSIAVSLQSRLTLVSKVNYNNTIMQGGMQKMCTINFINLVI